MITVYNLATNEKLYFTSNPKMAVIGAYAMYSLGKGVKDSNAWEWEERYSHLITEGKHCLSIGDWSVFKDGREF